MQFSFSLFFRGIFLMTIVISAIVYPNRIQAQQGIGTSNPHSSSILDVSSTDKGVLIPRLTQTQMENLSNPVAGLQIYNTTKNCLYTYSGSAWFSEKKFISKMVYRGDTVQLGNIRVRLPATGNLSAQIAFVSGSNSLTGTSLNAATSVSLGTTANSSISSYMRQSEYVGTTFNYWQAGLTFPSRGGTQQIWFTDETNLKFYKIHVVIGPANQTKSTIEIEELL
jgi:hypothetical protein